MGGAYQRTDDSSACRCCDTSLDVRRNCKARVSNPSAIGSKRTGGSPNASHRGSHLVVHARSPQHKHITSVGIIVVSGSTRRQQNQHPHQQRPVGRAVDSTTTIHRSKARGFYSSPSSALLSMLKYLSSYLFLSVDTTCKKLRSCRSQRMRGEEE